METRPGAEEERVKSKAPGTQCLESEPHRGVATSARDSCDIEQISPEESLHDSAEVTDGVTDDVIGASIVRAEFQRGKNQAGQSVPGGMAQTW